jgi:hypothetical protein
LNAFQMILLDNLLIFMQNQHTKYNIIFGTDCMHQLLTIILRQNCPIVYVYNYNAIFLENAFYLNLQETSTLYTRVKISCRSILHNS